MGDKGWATGGGDRGWATGDGGQGVGDMGWGTGVGDGGQGTGGGGQGVGDRGWGTGGGGQGMGDRGWGTGGIKVKGDFGTRLGIETGYWTFYNVQRHVLYLELYTVVIVGELCLMVYLNS